jgi:hypothetical protein
MIGALALRAEILTGLLATGTGRALEARAQ